MGVVGVVGVVHLDLHVPGSASLKAKRGPVKSLIARLRNDLHVAVAEVAHQDTWQRCGLLVAIAAGSELGVRKVADAVDEIARSDPRMDLLDASLEVWYPEGR